MRRGFALALVVAAACGRVSFDPYVGALAWYPLDDDPAGGFFRDATGHGHDAHCVPGSNCPTRRAGELVFDGSSQFLSMDPTGLELPAPYSITAWARPMGIQHVFGCMVCRPVGSQLSDTYALYIDPAITAIFSITAAVELVGTSLPPADWSHVAATYDGMTARLYENGVITASTSVPPAPFDGHAVHIGADVDNESPAGFFSGALADVRIYDRLLSDAEIAALYLDPGTPR